MLFSAMRCRAESVVCNVSMNLGYNNFAKKNWRIASSIYRTSQKTDKIQYDRLYQQQLGFL